MLREAQTEAKGWQKRTIATMRVIVVFRAVHVALAASEMWRIPVLSAHVNASSVSMQKMLKRSGRT